MLVLFVIGAVLASAGTNAETVQPTKLFIIPIEPNLFNWTADVTEEFKYTASLLRHPDLPEWMHFLYSRRHNKGFLYGVVPPHHVDLDIQLVAMNRRTYETKKRVIHLNVQEKSNPATHEVSLKIDNVNVEDLMDPYRMTRLLDIFRDKLWTNSFHDLYITFLASAVTQGARRPLKPNDGEGIVIRLGSAAPFSNKLVDLQEEVKPLWKIQSCPRDFKRTSVERWFRDEHFMLDWCSFKLITHNKENTAGIENWEPKMNVGSPAWMPISKSKLPERSYAGELAFTILVPLVIMVLLVFMLSFVLCCHHEGMEKEDAFIKKLFHPCEKYKRSNAKEEESDEKLTQYAAVQRATSTLRSLSRSHDARAPEPTLLPANDDVSRPTPPPYTGTTIANKWEI